MGMLIQGKKGKTPFWVTGKKPVSPFKVGFKRGKN